MLFGVLSDDMYDPYEFSSMIIVVIYYFSRLSLFKLFRKLYFCRILQSDISHQGTLTQVSQVE